MTNADVLARLAAALPAGAVVTDPKVLVEQAQDQSQEPWSPDALAVVRVRSAEEVSKVLVIANETRTPVVPQGSRSSVTGASNAIEGSILLDLSGMRRIEIIDELERIAVVQPGVLIEELQHKVAAQGLFYPPDPGSVEIASIGGSVSTNAGGMRCIKYGVTRDSVRSLEVVLADGSILNTRARTAKDVAGLDITDLIIGSEGTLAVITEVTLALRPAPGPALAVTATFPSLGDALDAANAVAAGRRLPSTLELIDGLAIRALREFSAEVDLPADAEAWLVAVTDEHIGAEEDLDSFEAAFRANGALTIERAATPADTERLLKARRLLNPATNAYRPGHLHSDAAVPRSLLREFGEQVLAFAAEQGVEVSISGHVGDGNLHPVVFYFPGEEEQAQAVLDFMLELAAEFDGTVTGEHGVGVEKLAAVRAQFDPRRIELQRALKAAFDPNGILNPGRKF